MIVSNKRCPTCNMQLLLTNSAKYWCTRCQAEKVITSADWKRDNILRKMKIEQAEK